MGGHHKNKLRNTTVMIQDSWKLDRFYKELCSGDIINPTKQLLLLESDLA